MILYDIVLTIATPFVVPYFVYNMAVKGKYKKSFLRMFGRGIDGIQFDEKDKLNIWLHSVSVGEVVAAKPLFELLEKEIPNAKFLSSTITETGNEMAHKIIKQASTIIYFPFDYSFVVNKFLNKFNPQIFVMMETELWPNFLTLAKQRGVRLFLINGKLSDKSYKRYKQFGFFFKNVLNRIDAFCMQTQTDADKMADLCGDSSKIFVTGNCKFDFSFKEFSNDEKSKLRRDFRLADNDRVIVVGSTHNGEEEIILDMFKAVKSKFPNIVMILAPRHPERYETVRKIITEFGLRFVNRTQLETIKGEGEFDIILLDTIGELANVYSLSEISIVGGSFVPIGGHNILEPAFYSVPVIYGPYMNRQPEMLELMSRYGGGIQVDSNQLRDVVLNLLSDESKRKETGKKARKAVEVNKGSAKRCVDIILDVVKKKGLNKEIL